MTSRVLPRWRYQDPAKVLEAMQLSKMGCRACASHQMVLGRVMCNDARNDKQAGVPRIGKKCKWFKED
jgi:hypothetical protein